MRLDILVQCSMLFSAASVFDCSPAGFATILPSNTSVIFAYPLSDGSTFQVPASNIGFPRSPTGLRALCAVEIRVPASGNTTYGFGLFLPQKWNGRFLAVGNAGFAGGVNWLDMGVGTGYGFAVMSTDTGHESSAFDASWAYNNPDKQANWGYRALHGSIVLSKHIVKAYYNKPPAYSYYNGCSTGGRQGLKEAEMFPDDFDGIVVGAPAWWTVHLQLWNMKVGLYNLPVTADYHIPDTMFSTIGDEVLKQCDPQDGLTDRIISDPIGCHFNPEALLCAADVSNATASACLTSPQITTLRHLYNDWVEANQTFIFPHFQLGSEAEWNLLVGADEPAALGTDYVKYMLGLGPDWSWRNWNPDIIALSDRINPGNATADDFDISPFYKKGGKLLHFHGLSDGSIATGSSIYYYNHVLRKLKPQDIDLNDFYQFFLIPGMQHCSGTPDNMNAPWYIAGANQASALGSTVHSTPGFSDAKHDVLLAMMAWVENGTAPNEIIATKYKNDTTHNSVLRQRPICKYPLQATYKGKGDVNKASSWTCKLLYR